MAITPSQWSHVLTIPESYTPSAATSGQTLVITESVIAKLSPADQTTFWSNVANGGGDVRICTDSGGVNQLPVEIVSLDNSAQTCVIWTRKASYDGTGNLYLFIGKVGETQPPVTDPFGRNAVWQDFRAVYHLSEAPNSTAGGYIDSTGNGYDGTGIGITSERNSSPLGYGQEFGGNKYIALPASVFPASAQSDFSISAWAQPDTLVGDQRIIGLENAVNNDDVAILWMDEGGAAKGWTAFTRVNNTSFVAGTDTASAQAGRWDLVVQNVSASVIEVYSNGSLLDTTPITLTVPPRTIDLANIGRTGSAPNEIFFSGGISQLEISLNYQSQELIETKHANQNDPAAFYGTPTIAETGGATGVTADITYTVNAPTFTSSASVTLPQPIADASFTVNAPTFSAEASATIPGFSASVSFAIPAPTFAADASVTLPSPTADVSYTITTPTFSVNADATLPQPSSDVAFTVNSPSFAATATATEPGFNASVNFAINAPTFSANASATLPQPNADVGFTVSAPTFSVVAIVGGIAIIVDDETNINVPALATNIDAPVQSNNVRI